MTTTKPKPRLSCSLPEAVRRAITGEKIILYTVLDHKKLLEGIIGERTANDVYVWHDNDKVENQYGDDPGQKKPTTKHCLHLRTGALNRHIPVELYETEATKPKIIIPANLNNNESLLYVIKTGK